MLKNIQAIILAAGKSTRFNTKRTKLLEKICGQEMIFFPLETLKKLNITSTMVVGYEKEKIIKKIKEQDYKVNFVEQENQKGTGHAVQITSHKWKEENILILNGDMPLIDKDIIKKLYDEHIKSKSVFSFITAHNADPRPNSYGKVVKKDHLIKIVEAKDATEEELFNCSINAGIYLVKKDFLQQAINQINESDKTGELYLTSLAEIASSNGLNVSTVDVGFDKVRGVNTLQELWEAEVVKRSEIIANMMKKGVIFENPIHVKIDLGIEIGSGSYVASSVILKGKTKIGKNCQIEPFSLIENAILEDEVQVHSHSVIQDSKIKANAQVGPFALIHSETKLGENSIIGHFVETKKTKIGKNSKAKHLAYLGDSEIGNHVNIGAGTITCNYDGHDKFKTIIKDNSFIGSNNSLVAPITVGKNTYTEAGTTIKNNVPDNCYTSSPSEQINKENKVEPIDGKFLKPSFRQDSI